ncbi:hypothetical protein PCANC_06079 [Puccinia coronata f. sp. avenae]|uniref:Uncharacterized protein n=1 Tax=Puccinia coronata f. sp. avenae TaxID=200324 RepID=A0A2N5VTT9_9BASI|nr:hypothetical protein PCANC_06079 [Puccinia coronata f. sp. avenae]
MDDLDNLLQHYLENGGISTLKHFELFRTHFEAIICYLVESGSTSYSYFFFDQFLLEVLSSRVQSEVFRKLIRDGQAYWVEDEPLVIPSYQIILQHIYAEYRSTEMLEEVPSGSKEAPKDQKLNKHQEESIDEYCPKPSSPEEFQKENPETPASLPEPSPEVPEGNTQLETMDQIEEVTQTYRINDTEP